MNILVISKRYSSRSSSADIQIKRVIESILLLGNNNITLLTAGLTDSVHTEGKLKILTINSKPENYSFLGRLVDRFVCSRVCLIKSRFVQNSIVTARQLIGEHPIDLLFTISTPVDAHIVGLTIRRSFPKLKWVILLTDIWPSSILPAPYKRLKLLSFLELSLMRNIIKDTDGVITQTKYAIKSIHQYFGSQIYVESIPHCSGVDSPEINNPIKGFIVHSGRIHKERFKLDLLEAIHELTKEDASFNGLVQIGTISKKVARVHKKSNCRNFHLLGELPVELASKIQSQFEVSLIIEAPMKAQNPFMPGKISDSIGLNKKIIVITSKDSFLKDFASENKGIFYCDYNKLEIKACIKRALRSEDTINKEAIEFFKPLNVAHQYEKVFARVIAL